MTSFDPFSPEFEDNPWDPRYDGGPGDLCDPAEFVADWRVAIVHDNPTVDPAGDPEGH